MRAITVIVVLSQGFGPCGSKSSETADADSAVSSDDDGGVSDCDPMGDPPNRTCPTGCDAIAARLVARPDECVTAESIVVGCYPRDAVAGGSGEEVCYEWADDDSIVVLSGSGGIMVEGMEEVLLESQGWTRCPEPASTYAGRDCEP